MNIKDTKRAIWQAFEDGAWGRLRRLVDDAYYRYDHNEDMLEWLDDFLSDPFICNQLPPGF